MASSTQINCIVDPYNLLTIYVGEDLDIVLSTERIDPNDSKNDIYMRRATTLRVRRGGGRYDTPLLSSGNEDKTLHTLFMETRLLATGKMETVKEAQEIAEADTPVEKLIFNSDDGGNSMSFCILNKADLIGVATIQKDKPHVPVWLGNAKEVTVLKQLWEQGIETFRFYTAYSNACDFGWMSQLPVNAQLELK